MDNRKIFIVLSTIIFLLMVLFSALGSARTEEVPIPIVRISYPPSSEIMLSPKDELMIIARLENSGGKATYGKIRVELPAKDFEV